MSPETKQQLERLKQQALIRANVVESANIVMLSAILDTLLKLDHKLDQMNSGGNSLLTERA